MKNPNRLASLIRKPLERAWFALTKEKIKELETPVIFSDFSRYVTSSDFEYRRMF
jgi:hypothetical protein